MLYLVPFMLISSYLVGSLPTGYLICKVFFQIDVTQHGSGNIGASNVARVLGNIRYFFLIFFIDAAKAFLSLVFADYFLRSYSPNYSAVQHYLLLCAAALVLGNTISIFLSFKGGKGVATTVGIVAYLVPFPLILLFISCWGIILGFTKHVFMASLGAACILLISYGLFFSYHDVIFQFFLAIFFWLIIRHKSNIMQFIDQ